MKRKLEYTLCRTRHNTPLVTLDSPLGNGQEIEPAALRALAQVLLSIAAEAEHHDMGRHYASRKASADFECS